MVRQHRNNPSGEMARKPESCAARALERRRDAARPHAELSGKLAIPGVPRTVTVAALTRIPDLLRLDIRHVYGCLRPESQAAKLMVRDGDRGAILGRWPHCPALWSKAGEFEGVHEGQQRGSGAVIIWDEGTAEIVPRGTGARLVRSARPQALGGIRADPDRRAALDPRQGPRRSRAARLGHRDGTASVRSGLTWQELLDR